MIGIRITIDSFEDSSPPGWVKCSFKDAQGEEWVFLEKIPVVTKELLDESSEYPRPGILNGEIINTLLDENDEELIVFDSQEPWGIESVDGESVFVVKKSQLIDE